MTLEELRLRQLAGQRLLSPGTPQSVVRALCGVQAQFLSYALHALRIRSSAVAEQDLNALAKSWTLRGTMHVFALADLPLLLHQGRRRQLRPCDTLESDACMSQARKQYFAELITEQVATGCNTREALKAACRRAGMTEQEMEQAFNPWGGLIRALCESGRLCYLVQEQKAFQLCPPFTPMEQTPAQLELARRYFAAYGPATIRDAAYFFGTTQAEIKALLRQLPVEAADCNGRTYYYTEARQPVGCELPACLFLAGFDPLLLGHQKTESLFLPPEHLRKIFNPAGIVMPAVLLHGKVVGKWKKTALRLNITLFESVSPQARGQLEQAALSLWPELRSLAFN